MYVEYDEVFLANVKAHLVIYVFDGGGGWVGDTEGV